MLGNRIFALTQPFACFVAPGARLGEPNLVIGADAVHALLAGQPVCMRQSFAPVGMTARYRPLPSDSLRSVAPGRAALHAASLRRSNPDGRGGELSLCPINTPNLLIRCPTNTPRVREWYWWKCSILVVRAASSRAKRIPGDLF